MNKLLTATASVAAIAATAASFTAQAQTAEADHAAHHVPAAASSTAGSDVALTAGEVRRLDVANKKVTLRHGPIVNLDMPGMTMVFQVADAQMLDNLSVGDKVRFTVENKQGALVVTTLEKVVE